MSFVERDVNSTRSTLVDVGVDSTRKSPLKSRIYSSTGVSPNEVLIEGKFIELDDQLWLHKQVRILVTSEFVYLTEHGTEKEINSQAHVLQHGAGKTVLKYHRADIDIELLEGCSYTFRAKWRKDLTVWRTYRLCGQIEVWKKWLRCFHLQDQQSISPNGRESTTGVGCPAIAVSYSASADLSSSDDDDEDFEGEEIVMPKCVTLCVDRAMSMLSMTMLNPSNVRKLAMSSLQHENNLKRASLGTIGSESEDLFDSFSAGSLFRSSSHPRLSDTKPFCTFSLMNVSELDTVFIEQDLRHRTINGKLGNERILDESKKYLLKSKTYDFRFNSSKLQNCTAAELVLHNRIENLRAHPSNLNFVRRHLWDDKTLTIPSPAHNRRLSLSLALTSDSHRIPQSTENIINVSPARRQLFRTESSPARPQISGVTATGSPERNTPVARRLDFKDDMAVDVSSSDQKPQKVKVRRFWTILQKKRTRNRPSISELEESPSKKNIEFGPNTECVAPPKLTRGRSFSAGTTGRGKYSDNTIGQRNSKRHRLMEWGITSPLSSSSSPTRKQGRNEDRQEWKYMYMQIDSEEDRKRSAMKQETSKGSVKKKFVQKILSPILKSTSLEENVGVSSSTELQFSPVMGDVILNGLPQGLVDIDAAAFAKEITLIDKELFVRILWHELETCGWMTKDKYVRSPNVMEMVEFFNRGAMLVASEILAEETSQARARVVSKVIQIADKCRLLGNFNSLKALMAGLQSAPIYRLKETWKEVSSKRRKKFRDLSILMGESDNFALYRSELSSCLVNGPCLPFLGDFLTQIAQTQAFLSVKRKKQKITKPSVTENGKNDPTDESEVILVTHVNCNGVTTGPRDEPDSCPTTPCDISPDASRDLETEPRDTAPITCSLRDVISRDRTKRGSARSRLKRFYSRQNSVDTGTLSLNHSRNNSAELLDIPSEGFRGKLMPASSDSVITSSGTLNGSADAWRFVNNSRTPGRPPLLRRLSESSSFSPNVTGFTGKPKRRLSESAKSNRTRRFFLDGFVRRSTSSSSVKESRVIRGMSNDRLGHSFSTQSIREGTVVPEDTLGKSVSTPVIKDGGNISSRDVSRDTSRDILESELENSEERRESLIKSAEAYHSGTERQLTKYQMAAIQYDFTSCAEVRQFLLNASFNTEEENYRLSLKREVPVKAS